MTEPLTQSLALELIGIAYLFFPLLGSALIQGLFIRYDWLRLLRRPIDFGAKFRERRVFGDNKTFRGLLGAGVGSSLFAVLQSEVLHEQRMFAAIEYFDYGAICSLCFGFWIGFVSSLSELPNSFAKRQLGIAPGTSGIGIWRGMFYFIDQVDILLGVWLYLSIIMEVTTTRVAVSIAFVFVIHQLVTVAGYGLGMRKTLR